MAFSSYRSSSGKRNRIQCRICNGEVLFQNYKLHLQRHHPDEDSNDLRGKTETPLSLFFPKTSATKESKETIHEETTTSSDDTKDTVTMSATVSVSEDVHMQEVEGTTSASKTDTHPTREANLLKFDEHVDMLHLIIAKLNEMSSSTGVGVKKIEDSVPSKHFYTPDYLMQQCKSISDITSRFSEFKYDTDSSCLFCSICTTLESIPSHTKLKSHPALFNYEADIEGADFTYAIQPERFRFLKRNLKRHLSTSIHMVNIECEKKKQQETEKQDAKEKLVGMRIGRICYHLAKHGGPDKDFPRLILLHAINDSDVGQINHSEQFPAKFLPYLSKEVKGRVQNFLSSRLQQTGFRPVGQVSADKATWKHRTRQFVAFTTVVPDSPKLLQSFFLGHPVVKSHTGQGVCLSITDCLEEYNITSEQYIGSAFDGAYFSLHVPEYLDKYFGFEHEPKHHIWDPLHRAGLQDTHIRKDMKFKWLVDHTKVIGMAFKAVNWGKEFEHFLDVAIEMAKTENVDIDFKMPAFFSETRFANSVRKVYSSFRHDYPALVRTLEETQARMQGGNALNRQKARDAANISNRIYNLKFAMVLSGLCDVYEIFGHGVNILQKVDMMPHIKYDRFQNDVIFKLRSMSACLEDCNNCPRSGCEWPNLHKDCKEITEKKEYRGLPITHQLQKGESSTRSGQEKEAETQSLNTDAVLKRCYTMLKTLIDRLRTDLNDNVFDEKDKRLIEQIRPILDLERLSIKLKLRGSALVAALETKTFLKNATEIVTNISDVPTGEVRLQFREFLNTLEYITNDIDEDDLDSSELLKLFLQSDKQLFKNIELVVHIMCVAAASMSVESVIESYVSIYEGRNNKFRSIGEDRAEMEMHIAINGPDVVHSDSIIRSAMRQYWGSKAWHFIRKSENIKDFMKSKVIDSFFHTKQDLPFM